MAINYCSWSSGNDTTGDGSAGNPYKTITKATSGQTGGDETRVEKSPDSTNLTGTLDFSMGSIDVSGTGTLFSSELAVGNFIKGDDGYWYEVVTITNDTSLELFKSYSSSSANGVSSQKLGATSTGEATQYEQVQVVSVSGSSTSSRLKISGGWDLSSETQTSETFFSQMHSTFENRYGWGLYATYKNYLEIETLHFLRYNTGVSIDSSSGDLITGLICCSNEIGFSLGSLSSNSNIVNSLVCNCNEQTGIEILANNTTITSPICNSNYGGISLRGVDNVITSPSCVLNYENGIDLGDQYSSAVCAGNVVDSPICSFNANSGISINNVNSENNINSAVCSYNTYGIMIGMSIKTVLNSPVCENNSSYGIASQYGAYTKINNYSGDWLATKTDTIYFDAPVIELQHYMMPGFNLREFAYGFIMSETAEARSTQCLAFMPSSEIYYISQSFFFAADSGVAQTLSAYMKDNADFVGDVQVAIYFMGKRITGWTEWTPTTSYVQYNIIASAVDITENGVLELKIKSRGTGAGCIYVDDLSTA